MDLTVIEGDTLSLNINETPVSVFVEAPAAISVEVAAPAVIEAVEVLAGLKGDKGDKGDSGSSSPVTSINGKIGAVTLTADDISDGTSNKAYTGTEKTKLAGIASGATVNSTDAQLRDRATHTGSQTSSTISDFTEAVQDAVAALLASGSNVTLTYNDAANTLTVSAAGGDAEVMRDTIGAALVGVGNVAVTVNDAADTITISTTATANSTDAQLRDRSTHNGTQAISTVAGLQTALDAKAASSDLGGTGANQWGIRPTIYWTGSAWPVRSLPAGYTGVVIWDSSTDSSAPAPPGANPGDLWDQYVG